MPPYRLIFSQIAPADAAAVTPTPTHSGVLPPEAELRSIPRF